MPETTARTEEQDDASLRLRLQMREQQIEAVHRISEALFRRNNLDDLLRETLDVCLKTVDADAGSILLYDIEKRKLVFRWMVGNTKLIGMEIDPEKDLKGKAATVFRTGEALITTDTRRDPHNAGFDDVSGYHTESILTVPLKIGGGQPIGVMQVLNKRHGLFEIGDQDLLEIISSLAATSIVNARLAEEAQLAAVARAVGDLGHDIKNALTPIETMVDTTVEAFVEPMFEDLDRLMEDWRREHPEMAEAVVEIVQPLRDWAPEVQGSVKDGCADIREMVSEIADYIKGAQSTNFEVGDIKQVLTERLQRLEVVARNRRVIIDVECDDIPPFKFDRRLMGRAVFNLVNNALGAMADAVKKKKLELRTFHVLVRVTAVAEGEFPDGHFCLVEVQDDGPGIPVHVLKTLFTSQAISTTPGGTGIGTRFVKSVADAHGGQVGVESELGQGARFWMKLPLAS